MRKGHVWSVEEPNKSASRSTASDGEEKDLGQSLLGYLGMPLHCVAQVQAGNKATAVQLHLGY